MRRGAPAADVEDFHDPNLVLYRKYTDIEESRAILDDLPPGKDYTLRVYAHVNGYVSDHHEFYESTRKLCYYCLFRIIAYILTTK